MLLTQNEEGTYLLHGKYPMTEEAVRRWRSCHCPKCGHGIHSGHSPRICAKCEHRWWDLNNLYDKYFKNKKAADDIEKATFAYHWDVTDHPNGHKWPSGHYDHKANFHKPMPDHIRFEKCSHCGRTRNDVRWDNLHAHCDNVGRPTISDILLKEESDFLEMLESSAEKIPNILAKRFKGELTAEALFFLQSSTGYPPDVVALHYDEQKIEALMPEFDRLMEEHQKKSGKFKGVK